jgi:adenylate cyclase
MKKYVLFIILTILSWSSSSAQKQGQELIDSLLHIYAGTKDNDSKLEILDNLSFEFFHIDPIRGARYAEQGLKLAQKSSNRKMEARFYNNLATNYLARSDYSKALDYFFKSLSINEELNNQLNIADNLINIGIVYHETSDFDKAIEYYEKALAIDRELDNKQGIVSDFLSLGSIYSDLGDYTSALSMYEEALQLARKLDMKRNVAIGLGNIGIVYYNLKNYDKAFSYYLDAQKVFNELGEINSEARAYGKIGKLYLEIAKDSVDKQQKPVFYTNDQAKNINNAIKYLIKSTTIFEEIGDIASLKEYYKALSEAYSLEPDYEKALQYHKKYTEAKDSAYSIESQRTIAKLENKRELDIKDKQIEIQQLKINNQRLFQISMLIGILILLTFTVFVIRERRKSERLLLNVLPPSIARRLKKNKGKHIADRFEHAAIVFCDIAGFTQMSSSISPEKLVDVLNDIFIKFDKITHAYDMEKIKTIGDCYMCVAGIPEEQKNAAKIAANWALEARSCMADYQTDDGHSIQLRFGIDCGPVVAGVIGEKKFIYDLWGDTVNTASRMESNGLLNEIHVSEKLRNALKDETDFRFEERGEIEIKGKGKMRTYLLKSAKE